MLLDSTMPAYDVREVHEVAVDASPDVVWSSLHEVPLRAVPVFRRLMTLRELPGLLLGRRWLTADVDRPILEQMTAGGFVHLGARPPSETVLGLLTRPWRSEIGRADDVASFLAFDAPGWTKAVLGFRLARLIDELTPFGPEPSGDGPPEPPHGERPRPVVVS